MEVVEEVNAVSNVTRSLDQIKEKYNSMRKEVKGKEAKVKRVITGTGGGPGKLPETEPWHDNILATLASTAIHGVVGGIDTSDPSKFKTFH